MQFVSCCSALNCRDFTFVELKRKSSSCVHHRRYFWTAEKDPYSRARWYTDTAVTHACSMCHFIQQVVGGGVARFAPGNRAVWFEPSFFRLRLRQLAYLPVSLVNLKSSESAFSGLTSRQPPFHGCGEMYQKNAFSELFQVPKEARNVYCIFVTPMKYWRSFLAFVSYIYGLLVHRRTLSRALPRLCI